MGGVWKGGVLGDGRNKSGLRLHLGISQSKKVPCLAVEDLQKGGRAL
jgi:hypothetical protein